MAISRRAGNVCPAVATSTDREPSSQAWTSLVNARSGGDRGAPKFSDGSFLIASPYSADAQRDLGMADRTRYMIIPGRRTGESLGTAVRRPPGLQIDDVRLPGGVMRVQRVGVVCGDEAFDRVRYSAWRRR